ncbi:MAG: hypothetical protein MSH58_08040 [Clostridiales bacterium]|nr:hypothetical protein [Clostridiales bacterium]
MARLGTERVDDILDYERDIKGRRLIRLRAGVGAGKNYWARHLLEKNPSLQILLITSRRNTADAEAYRLGTDCKIHISKLIDTGDKDWYVDLPGNMIVCTNSYIDFFFKNIYQKENAQTHLWNKFDLIFVDEVHSLTADASFADSPFAVERFIHHTLRNNPNCDVVAMSGTPESVDWLFSEEHWGTEYTSIDLYNRCIHLVPNNVYLFTRSIIPERIHYLWAQGKRLIYFANSVNGMAALVTDLQILGIPESDIGIAFTESENAGKLPQSLVKEKQAIRDYLVTRHSLPSSVKIFITTTQNKEGISIEDDDIKYMFSESHNKSDLEQMAGRVRGNSKTGTGLHALVVVYDAPPHPMTLSYIEQELDRTLVGNVESVMDQHRQLIEASGREYNRSKDIAAIQKNHPFLRYDQIAETFVFYEGREKCLLSTKSDQAEFDELMDSLYDHLYDELVPHKGYSIDVTGGYELWRRWFPHSELYHSSAVGLPSSERATNELLEYLSAENYMEVPLNSDEQQAVLNKIHTLIQKYGAKELGFGSNPPATLGPALKRFCLQLEPTPSNSNRDKVIHRASCGLNQ